MNVKKQVIKHLGLLLLILVVLSGCTSNILSTSTPESTQATSLPIEDLNLAIASQTPLKAIPNNYVGLSFELGQTCSLVDRANNPTFLEILKNLGTDKVLRIGGRSSDLTDWQPDGTYSCNMTPDAVKTSTPTIVTKSLIDEIFQLAAKLHWKVIWTVDLGSNDPEKFADEISYIESHYASMLIGLSIGSEPEIYQQYNIRPKNQTWGFDQYIAQWGAYRDAILAVAPKAPLIGPDSYCCTLKYTRSILDSNAQNLTGLANHYYISDNPQPIPTLLSSEVMDKVSTRLQQWRDLANNTKGKMLFVDEANSTGNGDDFGVSDSFAATLYLINFFFTGLENGVSNVDIHDSEGASFSPLVFNSLSVANPYYAVLFTSVALSQGGHLVPVTATWKANLTPRNVVTYAIVGNDGKLRVVILNKDTTNTFVRLESNQYTNVTAIRLEAPSPSSTKGTTFIGSNVAQSGSWNVTTHGSLISNANPLVGINGVIQVKPASAVMVTLSK